jgi:hypothetical protein
VLPETATEPWAEEADQVTGHGAEPFIPMRLPPAFLLDDLAPGFDERLEGPAPIGQRCPRAADGLCGESPVGERREDGPPTEQKPTRDEPPEQPEQPQIGADGHLGQEHTQPDRNTVDYGRHRASLLEYSVATLLYLRTCLMSASPPQLTGNGYPLKAGHRYTPMVSGL